MAMNDLLNVPEIAESLDICVGKSGKWVKGNFCKNCLSESWSLVPVKTELFHKKKCLRILLVVVI